MDTLKHLNKLGFSTNQQRVYLTLIEHGSAEIADLSRALSLPRTSIQSAINALLKKGVVIRHSQSRNLYEAAAPESLLRIIDREREDLDRKTSDVNSLIEQLRPFFGKRTFRIPKIQFFEGKPAIHTMLYEHSPLWNKNIMDGEKIVWGYQDTTYFEEYKEYSQHYWQQRKEHNQNYRICLFADKIEKQLTGKYQVPNREIRQLPLGVNFTSTLWTGGDYIIMISTSVSPHYAIEIFDRELSHNIQVVFKMLWSIGDNLPSEKKTTSL